MNVRGADLLKHAMKGGLLAGSSAPPANRLTMLKEKGLFSQDKNRRTTGSVLLFSASVSEREDMKRRLAPEYHCLSTHDPKVALRWLKEPGKIIIALIEVRAQKLKPTALQNTQAMIELFHHNAILRTIPRIMLLPARDQASVQEQSVVAQIAANGCGHFGAYGWMQRPLEPKALKDRVTLILMANDAVEASVQTMRQQGCQAKEIQAAQIRKSVRTAQALTNRSFTKRAEVHISHIEAHGSDTKMRGERVRPKTASGLSHVTVESALCPVRSVSHLPQASSSRRNIRSLYGDGEAREAMRRIGHAVDLALDKNTETKAATFARLSSALTKSTITTKDALLPQLRWDVPENVALFGRCAPQIGNGVEWLRRGDVVRGEKEFGAACLIDPRCVLAHELRGVCRAELGQLVESLNDFNHCEYLINHSSRKGDQGEGDGRDNMQFGEHQLEHRKRLRDLLFNRGVVFVRMGCDARALADFKCAHSLAVGDAVGDHSVLCAIGLVQRRTGHFRQAQKTYLRAAALAKSGGGRKLPRRVRRSIVSGNTVNISEQDNTATEDMDKDQNRAKLVQQLELRTQQALKGNVPLRATLQHELVHAGMKDGIHSHIFHRETDLVQALNSHAAKRTSGQCANIATVIMTHPFFMNLPKKSIQEIAKDVEYVKLDKNEHVLQEGDTSDSLFLVLNGQLSVKKWVQITSKDKNAKKSAGRKLQRSAGLGRYQATMNVLQAGDAFGHVALLKTYIARTAASALSGATGHAKYPSSATVIADQPSELFCISSSAFHKYLGEWLLQQRKRKVENLRMCGAWKSLSDIEITNLADIASLRSFAPGDLLEVQGMATGALMVLVRGMCSVRRYPDPLVAQRQLVIELKQMAQKTRQQGQFHHLLRHPKWPDADGAALRGDLAADAEASSKLSQTLDKWRRVQNDMNSATSHLQEMEAMLAEMEAEAERLNKVEAQKVCFIKRNAGTRSVLHRKNKHIKTSKEIKVTDILPPALIGEQTATQPGGGALATVKAETHVEVLYFSKYQVQQWHLKDSQIQDIAKRGFVLPTNAQVEQIFDMQPQWHKFKGALLEFIPKLHWPVKRESIRSTGHAGGTVIIDEGRIFGSRYVKVKG